MIDHRCRGRGATREALIAIEDTLVPIGLMLVPECCEQGLNRYCTRYAIGAKWFLYMDVGIGQQVVNLMGIGVKQRLHVVGHAVDIKRAVADGQNFLGAVITGHNDKIAVGVEDVERSLGGIDLAHLGEHQLRFKR